MATDRVVEQLDGAFEGVSLRDILDYAYAGFAAVSLIVMVVYLTYLYLPPILVDFGEFFGGLVVVVMANPVKVVLGMIAIAVAVLLLAAVGYGVEQLLGVEVTNDDE